MLVSVAFDIRAPVYAVAAQAMPLNLCWQIHFRKLTSSCPSDEYLQLGHVGVSSDCLVTNCRCDFGQHLHKLNIIPDSFFRLLRALMMNT